MFDKSRNYNLISHNSNNSPKKYNLQYNNEKNSKNEKKYSLKPKHPRSSNVSSINLTPNSNGKPNHKIIETIKASSPVKIIDIKKVPISERKNKFNSKPKNIKSYQLSIQTKKHFKPKRESSVPITIINLFDDNLDTKKIDKKNEKILQTLKNFIVHIYYTKMAANITIFIIVYEIDTISLKMDRIFHTIKKHLNKSTLFFK